MISGGGLGHPENDAEDLLILNHNVVVFKKKYKINPKNKFVTI